MGRGWQSAGGEDGDQTPVPAPDLADVGVGSLRVDAAVLPDVLEGVGHVAAAAAIVVGHTIHQVLGAKGEQLPRLPFQLPLQRAHRAESPARATLALRVHDG